MNIDSEILTGKSRALRYVLKRCDVFDEAFNRILSQTLGDAQVLTIEESGKTTIRVADVVARVAAQHDIKTEITPTDSLVDCGMTSMAMVDLMLAIEAEFDVLIPQREMTPQNFQTIAALAAMLDRL